MELTNIKDIQTLLGRHGFRFSKSMGQNFLTASWVPERIALECGADSKTGVLEIGPGIGCLTQQLSLHAGKVVAVEIDRRLPPLLSESLRGCDNVEIFEGDVMALDLPSFTAEHLHGLNPIVCANLPYNITSPVLTAIIESHAFRSATVMVQREVAQRMAAHPGISDYGAFSVFINWFCEPEILFDVPPDCFIPQPKVWSSVIRLVMRETPPVPNVDEKMFFRVVRSAFAQRRKTLVNSLSSSFGSLDKKMLSDACASCGFDANVRGEQLGIPEFCALASEIELRLK